MGIKEEYEKDRRSVGCFLFFVADIYFQRSCSGGNKTKNLDKIIVCKRTIIFLDLRISRIGVSIHTIKVV